MIININNILNHTDPTRTSVEDADGYMYIQTYHIRLAGHCQETHRLREKHAERREVSDRKG